MRRNIVPAESGITGDLRPYANLGKVKNGGIDLNIEYNKAFSKDLIVSLKGSFTYAKMNFLKQTNLVIQKTNPTDQKSENH